MASTTKGRRAHHHDREGCSLVIAQDVQEVGGGEGIRLDALHEANIFHSSFFNSKPLCQPAAAAAAAQTSSSSHNTPSNERLCLGGHRETIFGISFSPDGVFLATASQDSTIAIWSVESHRLVATLKEGINAKYECLRVAWSMTTTTNAMTQRCNNSSEKYLLASAGADGIARLWSASAVDPTAKADKSVVNDQIKSNNGDQKREEPLQWQCSGVIDHYAFEKVDRNGTNSKEEEEDEINDRPQIYALQFIRDNRNTPKGTTITNYDDRDANNVLLLTSANDCIYLWNIVAGEEDDDRTSNNNTTIHSRKEFHLRTKIQFSHVKDETRYNINSFGGERNPDNAIYVFDASCCEKNGWLGVALSDGTCRVSCQAMETFDRSGDDGDKINSLSYREQCVLGLPPNYYSGNNSTRGGGHLTALSWDTSGTRLATCFASGRVVLWSIRIVNNGAMHGTNDVLLQPSLISVLEGGHDAGRPLFGAKYCGGINEDLLLTWGVDGRVCLWDSYSIGEVPSPLCTLISQPNYPIYALDLTMERKKSTDSDEQERQALHVMAIGGGVGGGFCGVPVYLYDIFSCVQIPDRIS